MEMPDFSNVSQSVKQYMPELMYATAEDAARTNRERISQNLAYFRANPEAADARLEELAQEWDVNRVLQVAASGLMVTGFWFSLTKNRLWLLLPLIMAGGSLHQGITGTSPAEEIVRRFGFRTRDEIQSEIEGIREITGGGSSGRGGQAVQGHA